MQCPRCHGMQYADQGDLVCINCGRREYTSKSEVNSLFRMTLTPTFGRNTTAPKYIGAE